MGNLNSQLGIYPSFFDDRVHGELLDLARQQPERKRIFDLSNSDAPDIVFEARDVLVSALGVRINTAIIKRYSLTDIPPSGAYVPHPDPKQFGGEYIELCTLDGEADFFVADDGQELSARCVANTLAVIDPALSHWVTPPLNPEGVRHIAFFGFDSFIG